MTEKKKEEGKEAEIHEGRLAGIFTGFRNHDTIFHFQGGSSWRQDEYFYRSHYRESPRARIVKVIRKTDQKEFFYIEIDGIETPVEVKPSYA